MLSHIPPTAPSLWAAAPYFKTTGTGNSPHPLMYDEHAVRAECPTPPTFTIMQVAVHEATCFLYTASRFMTDGRKHRSTNSEPTAFPYIQGTRDERETPTDLAEAQAQRAHATTTPGDL